MKPPLSLLLLYYPATIKEVSRFNILFDGEDEAALEALELSSAVVEDWRKAVERL